MTAEKIFSQKIIVSDVKGRINGRWILMTYPDAYKGVKKIFIAQILALITVVMAGVVNGLTSGVEKAFDITDETMALAGSLGIAVLVIGILVIIMYLIGLRQAGRDEIYFRSGFTFAVIELIGSIAKAIGEYTKLDKLTDIGGLVEQVAEILVIVYVIYGVIHLAQQLDNDKVVGHGRRLLSLVTIMLLVSLIIRAIANYVTSESAEEVLGIAIIAASIVILIAYFIYILLLGRAVKMLKN